MFADSRRARAAAAAAARYTDDLQRALDALTPGPGESDIYITIS